MATKTIHTCDKCGTEISGSDQKWKVGVFAKCMLPSALADSNFSTRYEVTKDHAMEVCRPCLEAFGIYATKKEQPQEAPQPPTLEDLIRELVRQELPQ